MGDKAELRGSRCLIADYRTYLARGWRWASQRRLGSACPTPPFERRGGQAIPSGGRRAPLHSLIRQLGVGDRIDQFLSHDVLVKTCLIKEHIDDFDRGARLTQH
jgi:hypothetical protein